eukprot:CCRYP_004246-RA/>CCRYP_004246-RA protein AED:0.35 eAED:0.35 QI:0/0/0/0.75/1/1/4/0/1339
MLGWWSEDPRVPEYINRLEDAQKKAARANLPITNDWLAAIATMSLLAAGSFPKLRLDWDGLASADKTWPAWKTWALKAQKLLEREQRASGTRGDVFGSASSAIAAHCTSIATFHPTKDSPSNNQLPTLSELESHLDNMALAVTNEKAVLDSLVSSNATLTKLTADKLAKLEKLVLDLKPSTHRPTQTVQPPATSARCPPLLPPIPSTATPHCLHTQPLDHASPWSTVPGAYTAPQPPTSSPLLSLSSNSNPYRCLEAPASPPRGCAAQISTTAILDSGASDIYFAPDAPVTNVNPSAPTSTVTDAAGTHHHSSAHANHLLPTLPACSGKIMPSFKHTLFGVGPLCDNGCKVLFDSASATIYDKRDDTILLQGWREPTGAKLWRFSLLPDTIPSHHVPHPTSSNTPSALNATNLPSVCALVHYLHAAAGFPVKSTWLAAIKAGNYASWPGLTYANASRHCPDSSETIKGHLTQTRKGIRSTKPKPPPVPSPSTLPSPTPSHELHIVTEPISKLYTDDMGRFPIRSRSGNQYIMLAYHCDSNAILVEPFQSRHDRHRIAAHGRIMTRLRDRDHPIEHQILDNEASENYRQAITQDWKATYQLVPPNVHRANAAERAIRTFKAHFLSVRRLQWPAHYDATPRSHGVPVIIHNKTATRKSWDFRGRDGFSIGPALHHYRCFQVVDSATNCVVISDTVEFRHSYLNQPAVTYADRLLHAINYLSSAIADAPSSALDSQLQAITALRNLFANWNTTPTAKPPVPPPLQRPAPPSRALTEPQSPRVVPTPVPVPTLPPHHLRPVPPPDTFPAPSPPATTQPPSAVPIAQRTRSQHRPLTPHATDAVAHRTRSKLALLVAALASRQIWSKSYANELGRLCQGVGTNDSGTHQRVQGTDTFYVIDYDDIPSNRRSEITYSKVVCKVRPEKSDPDRTRITIGGNCICYPGDVGTRTAPLELVKLMINSVLSRHNAKFCTFDISNFYLGTPLDRPEYVRIRIDDIPQEFIDEYDLTHHVRDGWVYFQIVKGVYGLPQSGILANKLLETRLNAAGYYQLDATPGLWRHKWRPVMFTLIVDDFGVEYVGLSHAHHLRDVLQTHYDITQNWKGDLYAGINLAWNYSARSCRLTMKEYIATLLFKYNHPPPKKRQLSPFKATPIVYGAKTQFSADPDNSPPLPTEGIKRVQGIVGALLYYARAVDNKLLHALSDIGTEQASATSRTNDKVNQLLDYCATYPNDGITYRSSDMVLSAHSDAAYLNASKSRSRAGAYIMCSENDPVPSHNGPVLTIAQIIKFVTSSTAESELAALFICAKEMVPLRQSLIEMGWPQPQSPIQTDNTTALVLPTKPS